MLASYSDVGAINDTSDIGIAVLAAAMETGLTLPRERVEFGMEDRRRRTRCATHTQLS